MNQLDLVWYLLNPSKDHALRGLDNFPYYIWSSRKTRSCYTEFKVEVRKPMVVSYGPGTEFQYFQYFPLEIEDHLLLAAFYKLGQVLHVDWL